MKLSACLLILASVLAPASVCAHSDGPRELRIIAHIDGLDELHLGPVSARVEHLEFEWPKFISIAGREWNPESSATFEASEEEPFFPLDLDLAGAEVQLLSGPGTIDFWQDAGGLVLRFDDSRGGGVGEYEVLVRFADELCSQSIEVGDVQDRDLQYPSEFLVEAHIDGVDELHLGPTRADWLHLEWDWPKEVRLAGLEAPEPKLPIEAPPGTAFFSPFIDLDRVRMKVEQGRGDVDMEVHGGRLFLRFDDGGDGGAADYRVRLTFPKAPRRPKTLLPTGEALCVELSHGTPEDVAGARVLVQALSPLTDEFVTWPGLRAMDAMGRCKIALPVGSYRFEVLHRPAPNKLVALRTEAMRITRSRRVDFEASEPQPLRWQVGESQIELLGLGVHGIEARSELGWERDESGSELVMVASPGAEFSLRAFGQGEEGPVLWWTQARLGDDLLLRSGGQAWIECSFGPVGREAFPKDCVVIVFGPTSSVQFPVTAQTRLRTNRRFLGFGYEHSSEEGSRAVFHQRQVLLPKPGRRQRFELGGAMQAVGSAWVLQNENLGSAEARELWWELNLVDEGGWVLNTQASDIAWQAQAQLRDGGPVPTAPLEPVAVSLLENPTESVRLRGSYVWNGKQEFDVVPAEPLELVNEHYRSTVPGHLGQRAQAYMHKAWRTYRLLESAIGRPGTHEGPIELKWWLNGGAVGVWGSITMPMAGMYEDYDWFSFPWALAHESLHGFGYHHGPELDRLDREAIEAFDGHRWQVERDPAFVPPAW